MAFVVASASTRERIEATARAFLSAFEEGGAQNDPSIINRNVTADCKRHMLPASIYQAFGMPADFAFDTSTFQQTCAKDLTVLKFKNSIMSNLVIDTEARRASFTSLVEVHPNNGETYSNEQAWVLYFNEDGSEVEKVVEFCDKDVVVKMANTSA